MAHFSCVKLLVFLSLPSPLRLSPMSSFGLPIINSDTIYRESLLNHPEKQMVSLVQIPGIIMDLRYATTNNFMHKRLYPKNTKNSFLRKPVYQALDNVARELARQGLILVDHPQAAVGGGARVVVHHVGRAVRRDHAHLVRDAEVGEHVDRALHHGQVGVAAHDHADERRVGAGHGAESSSARLGLGALFGEVGLVHHAHELLEARPCGFQPSFSRAFDRVADQQVDLGRAVEARVLA